MKTIKSNMSNEIIIKNSKFICLLIKINSIDISDILNNIKQTYPKATHYCYGFIYNNYKKASDDGEPTGTAGIPILNVLEKNSLNNILCVVVRYFGGIKLGAGGLLRAYTKSVTECLKETEFIELIEGYKINLEFNYNDKKQIDYLLNNSNIIKKEFNKTINYQVLVTKDILNKLHNYKYNIVEELYIEKV